MGVCGLGSALDFVVTRRCLLSVVDFELVLKVGIRFAWYLVDSVWV